MDLTKFDVHTSRVLLLGSIAIYYYSYDIIKQILES